MESIEKAVQFRSKLIEGEFYLNLEIRVINPDFMRKLIDSALDQNVNDITISGYFAGTKAEWEEWFRDEEIVSFGQSINSLRIES